MIVCDIVGDCQVQFDIFVVLVVVFIQVIEGFECFVILVFGNVGVIVFDIYFDV